MYDEFSVIFVTSIDVDECKEKQEEDEEEEDEEEDGSGVCEEGKYCFNIPGSFRCNGRWRDCKNIYWKMAQVLIVFFCHSFTHKSCEKACMVDYTTLAERGEGGA